MKIDVLYLCHGRLAFTAASLTNLLAVTDWGRVQEFVVYNDATPDAGATTAFVEKVLAEHGVGTLRCTNLRSPVAVMNHFLGRTKAHAFAKIDNDIIVPRDWLGKLAEVMEQDDELELLGMEPGMSDLPPVPEHEDRWPCYGYTPSSHIGGVGLMRVEAFKKRPRPVADGRFGFTEWQHEHEPVRGWLCPDIRMFALDLLPIDPWRGYTLEYQKMPGLQRVWPTYNLGMSYYWDWWCKP